MAPPPPVRGSGATLYRYLSYQEVTGKRPTRGEMNRLLGRIKLADALRNIALLNSACTEFVRPSLVSDHRFQVQMVALLFSREWRERLCGSRWASTPHNCAMFHRQQQLTLLQVALENSPLEGGMAWDEEARAVFAEASLMANDLLADRGLSPEEVAQLGGVGPSHQPSEALTDAEQWDIRARTLPTLEFNIESSFRNSLGRARRLWVDLPHDPALRQRAGKDWLDWSGPFAERYKISLRDFHDITAALLLYTSQADPRDENSLRFLIFDPYEVLKNTRLRRETIAAGLEMISRSAALLQEELPLQERRRFGWDLTNLAPWPLISLGDGSMVAYDQTILLKAATEGVYWRVQDALPNAKAFGNMFGHVYDEYVGRILRRIVPASEPPTLPRYHPNPFFQRPDASSGKAASKNDEVCDGLVNCEPSLVLAEVKASVMTPQAKYSGNGAPLKQVVDAKFAVETGVRQLASAILRLARGDEPRVPGYDGPAIRQVFPILVSYDGALATPLLNLYLNQSLSEQLESLPPSGLAVGKLIVLSTFDVESLEAVCLDLPLDKVLARYERECPPSTPFRFFLQGNYWDKLNTDKGSTAEAFGDVAQSIQRLLFGVGEVLAADGQSALEAPPPQT